MNNDDILKNLDNEDTEEFSDTVKKSSNEKFSVIFDKINDFWDKSVSNTIAFLKKLFKQKNSMKNYENSENNKHEKIFKLLFKYLSILIAISFLIVLIVAFFKVFIFSQEITEHPTRTTKVHDVEGIDFDISSSYSWESKISQDVKNNSKNIASIKKSIEKSSSQAIHDNASLKEFIAKNTLETKKSFEETLNGVKKEFSGYVNQSREEIQKNVDEKLKNVKTTPLNGSFMEIPKKVVEIKDATEKFVDGVISKNDSKKVADVKPEKKEDIVVKKKIAQRDKDIYTSVNIETVESDASGYDSNNINENENNNTLPPVILRQGMSNGVLVTGVSAPTFEQDKNPASVFLTFKGKSIISNMFEQDVENCTATGSVFGNIITRRAEILVNKISCTYMQDGKHYMVRSNVKAWVYDGYDGRLGIPGILVDNSGAILNDSVIIGMLQGFGKFVSSSAQIYAQQGQTALSVGGVPTYSAGQVAQTNMAAGLGEQLASGFDTITDYYQRIIDTLYPYIDVKGGRKISIFFDGGETLTPKEYEPFLVNEDHDSKHEDKDDIEVEVSLDDW